MLEFHFNSFIQTRRGSIPIGHFVKPIEMLRCTRTFVFRPVKSLCWDRKLTPATTQRLSLTMYYASLTRGSRGEIRGPDPPPPPPKNHKSYRVFFFGNTGLDPLEHHKATKPAFNVGSSSACQRNTIHLPVSHFIAFCWRAAYGPLLEIF